MQDNPIYGNLSFVQTSTTALTEIHPPKSTLSPSSLQDQLNSNFDSQCKPSSDCYANLNLKTPKTGTSARGASQVEYSLVEYSLVFRPEELRKEDKADAVSDVYACVPTKRGGDEYANHI
ncbi:uncharacterized protein LOC133633684 isoform X2 [Entelurus aequoreus]|uniref:uncharacterized protein LOC133633684 isoform X2 n=1 Tax=Entelurus aequoreus TaxID=161455 RepID=UPI002B1E6E1C|nr:uncharacterized protein LOC133633684 isoform X2 [Entelurus aequoreus]